MLKNSRKRNNRGWVPGLLVLLVLCTYCWGDGKSSDTKMVMATTSIPFDGVATGGQLVLAEALNRNMRIAVIQTEAGESAESVANRLAEYIDENNPFEWGGFKTGQKRITAEGGVLNGLAGGRYLLAGTEMGLGIPLPPYSLTCTVDKKTDTLSLNWENSQGGYDKIKIIYNWTDFDHRGGDTLDGNTTNFMMNLNEHPKDTNDLDIWVVGVKNRLSSNVGAIHISNCGKVQEEFFGIPFKNGVAPNWKSWSMEKATHNKIVEGLVRSDFVNKRSNTIRNKWLKSASTKPFYQILKTPQEGGTVGIWRQFLGLNSGHTYRITARLNTLQMDPNNPDWSFSLHAVPDRGTDKLTERQMAGLAALPDGKSGPQVGRVVSYGAGITTKGEYASDSADITLPADSNSITVWLRLTGKNTSGVGFDWIKLEDLGVK